jgi:hypothetical protein
VASFSKRLRGHLSDVGGENNNGKKKKAMKKFKYATI